MQDPLSVELMFSWSPIVLQILVPWLIFIKHKVEGREVCVTIDQVISCRFTTKQLLVCETKGVAITYESVLCMFLDPHNHNKALQQFT